MRSVIPLGNIIHQNSATLTIKVIADTGNKSNKCQERENKMLIYN